MAGGGGEATTIEYTPTWVVAVVCTVIVGISVLGERSLHYAGKYLQRKNQKPLYEALLKIKEELMLLGFISLLLTISQDTVIKKICIPSHLADKWLPCKKESSKEDSGDGEDQSSSPSTAHFQVSVARHLLAEASGAVGYCEEKGKAPLLSQTALHHLHIFIFVLAVVHVAFCALTVVFGAAKMRQWKRWEDSLLKEDYDPEEVLKTKVTHVKEHTFIKDHFLGIGKRSTLLGWVHSFFKQFYGSVTKSDYITLRLGFIMTHFRGNHKFNFHKYMMRALEADFKRVVGISWYLWLFVVVFLLLNINGWHMYFWITFIPLFLLIAVGTKLEHVISQLAHEVAEKHIAIEGDLVVKPSDDHFWFHSPRLVLILIHILLFQNSFEIAFFIWIWLQYGFDSCIMGRVGYIIPRLVVGGFVQFVCSYSTLPLYAIVTQMGTSFKKAIFEEHIHDGLVDWAQKARRNKGLRKAAGVNGSSTQVGQRDSSHQSSSGTSIQLAENTGKKEQGEEEQSHDGRKGEIETAAMLSGDVLK